VSQGRAPLSQPKVRKILDTTMNISGSVKRAIQHAVNELGFEVSRRRPKPPPPPERPLLYVLRNLRDTGSDAVPFLKYCASNMDEVHAQLFQDLLVLFLLDGKRDGYFVEFGAMDGITLSNTFLLESKYSWRGIAAEPARCWHQELRRNRTCSLDHRCVWSKSGKMLQFNETPEAECSTIDAFSKSDLHAERRQEGNRYTVETISLRDLLRAHDAPRSIDYLSIDTEGSEFAILESFLPSHYEVRIITVEHNYTDQRSRIHGLLTSQGYNRIFEELSAWDDWYIKR
jgi:FkbM family methyltransferase